MYDFPLVYEKPVLETIQRGINNLLLEYPNLHVFETDTTITIVNSDEDFDAYKIRALNEINSLCEKRLEEAIGNYPDLEISSFSQQLTEANKYLEDSTYIPPLLTSIAESRGITLEELVDKVIRNATAYSTLSGRYMGLRQKQIDRINDCTTLEELKEVMETSVLN